MNDNELCEHCGYPAASGHPSNCAYWNMAREAIDPTEAAHRVEQSPERGTA